MIIDRELVAVCIHLASLQFDWQYVKIQLEPISHMRAVLQVDRGYDEKR